MMLLKYTQDIEVIQRVKHALFYTKEWDRLDEGTISLEEVKAIAKARVPEAYHQLIDKATAPWLDIKIYEEVEVIIRALKAQGYKLILCSNVGTIYYDFAPAKPIFKVFDKIYLSTDMKLLKPDYRYYLYVLNDLGIKGDECFFIDDSFANIKAAWDCGIEGFWHTGQIEDLRRYLNETGVLS